LPLDGLAAPAEDARLGRAEFVTAMANAATGVTVVATDGAAGRVARTVSAMCSVSADPPTVLVAVNRRSPLTGAVATNGVFGVSVLSERQAHVSETFAGRPAGGQPYDFGCASWTRGHSGAPVLDGAAATFDCAVVQAMSVATHIIFVGRVLASGAGGQVPLTYHDRGYRRLAAPAEGTAEERPT
jgi:flavin reductase (DIM6/NTAB) family NADH-FMN oxidoreductase RutF